MFNQDHKLDECLTALTSVLGQSSKELPLHEPCFEGNEWQYVKACLDSGWVSSVGEYVTLFEQKIAEFTGVPFVIAVVNGTAALHICLKLADIQQNDEVLLPSVTFVATANAVAYCGAIAHFIDCGVQDLNIDIEKLSEYLASNTIIQNNICINKHTKRPIKAIIPVHIFGHPVDMHALRLLCEKYYLTLIEDAAESLGSYYHGKHTGHFGDVASLSFNGNKILTTGGGGAILTHNEDWARRAKHITTTAKRAHHYEFFHDELGYNYRLPNLNAALGCAQIENLPRFVAQKRALAHAYTQAFSSIDDVKILNEPINTQSNYWLNALILDKPNRQFIHKFIENAHQQKYGLRGLWTPLDSLPMYQTCPKMDLSNTYRLFDSVIALPSGPQLGKNHV